MNFQRLILVISFVFAQFLSSAQEKVYKDFELKNFNVGISNGLGEMHFIFRPAAEIKLYDFSFRFAYGLYYWGYGIDYEVLKINKNLIRKFSRNEANYLFVSYIRNYQHSPVWCDGCHDEYPYYGLEDRYSLSCGIKGYSSPRIAFSAKIGLILNQFNKTTDFNKTKSMSKIQPLGEVSMVLYIRKNEKIN